MNLFQPTPERLTTTRQIKSWVTEIFQSSPEDSILVSESSCSEPGCSPVETVIAVFRQDSQSLQIKIQKPMQDVTKEDIETALKPQK
jgi:hypothetical protein